MAEGVNPDTLNIISLFMQADWVVKLVMIGLAIASLWSWAVILDKSVRFGACMVMIGSLFAGHEESPGRTVEVDGKLYKEYYGSASDFNKGEYKHVEGKRILEPIKGKLAEFKESLTS